MTKSLPEEKRLKWRALIEQQFQSGLSVKAWCLQNEVSPQTFQYWKTRLPRQLEKSSFVELKPRAAEAISLRARGLYIRIEKGCDPHLRKQLLAFIGEVAC